MDRKISIVFRENDVPEFFGNSGPAMRAALEVTRQLFLGSLDANASAIKVPSEWNFLAEVIKPRDFSPSRQTTAQEISERIHREVEDKSPTLKKLSSTHQAVSLAQRIEKFSYLEAWALLDTLRFRNSLNDQQLSRNWWGKGFRSLATMQDAPVLSG